MSRRLLEQFVTVAEEEHFTRAAQRLSMSQPPLTQAINRLEKILGVQLLERSTRQVQLTPAGHAFALDARSLLDAQKSTFDRVRRIAHGTEGELRIGFIGGAAHSTLPTVVGELHRSLPGVHAHLYQRTSAELADMVRSRRLDLALVRAPLLDPSDLEASLLQEDPLVCALPADHTLVGRDRIELDDLRDEPFALPSTTHLPGIADMIRTYCRSGGFEPRDGGRADTVAGMLALVAAGCGLCLVPEGFASGPTPGVIYLRLATDPPLLQTLAIRHAAHRDPLVDRLLALVVPQRHGR